MVIKEALHINWRKPNLCSPCSFLSLLLLLLLFCICVFRFHLLFSLFLTLIIGIFYCLDYTSLLLHLIPTHLLSHFSLSPIIFIISMLVIGIYCIYCLNYTLLLLHLIITHLVNIFYNNYVVNIYPRQLL